MKTHLSSVMAILTVSVALGVNAAPTATNSATAATETTAGTVNVTGIPRPQSRGFAYSGGIPAGNPYFGPTATPHAGTFSGGGGGAAKASVIEADTSRTGLFGPPQYSWQNLPYKTEVSPAPAPPRSNAAPAELHRSAAERQMTRIQKLVQEGGLIPPSQWDKRFDEKMTQIQTFQPNVSFSGDQINILRTFLQ
jgi:hypothetical protein